jgi:hypothetical protein
MSLESRGEHRQKYRRTALSLPLRRCYVFRNLVTSGSRGYNDLYADSKQFTPAFLTYYL